MPGHVLRCRRRPLLAVGAVSAGAALLGVPGAAGAAAGPTAAVVGTPVSITMMYQAGLWDPQQTTTVLQALWDASAPLRAAHRSLRLQITPLLPGVETTDFAADTAPDVVAGWFNFSSLANHGFLLDLTPYLRAENVSTNVWPTPLVDSFRVNGSLYALPFYIATDSMVANLSLADQLGLGQPEAAWTWADWLHFWEATTVRGGKTPRAGGAIFWCESGIPEAYLRGWGANLMDPAAPARCLLDQPAAYGAMSEIVPLVQNGVCTLTGFGGADMFTGLGHILRGQLASTAFWDAAVAMTSQVEAMVAMTGAMKWDFFPMPTMPQGSFAYTARIFRAINASTRFPEAAWEVLRWVAYDPTVQRTLMRFGLQPPALKSLQEEYVTVLGNTVPLLRRKNLAALIAPILNNQAVPQPVIPFAEAQAHTLVENGEQAVLKRQTGLAHGLRAIAGQVDALESTGSAVLVGARRVVAFEDAQLAAAPAPGAHYAPPPLQGAGSPSRSAPALVSVSSTGAYRLLGDGAGVSGIAGSLVVCALPVTASSGEWTARVQDICDLSCTLEGLPLVPAQAQVGLLAATDLSDDPAFVAIAVSAGSGLLLAYRPVPGVSAVLTDAISPASTLTPQALNPVGASPASHLLRRPVWLRLSRSREQWTAYASTDGLHWVAVAPPVRVTMAGCWVGVYACAANAVLGNKGYVRGLADRLSFRPSRAVQVGGAGSPPSAGPVPAGWATTTPAPALAPALPAGAQWVTPLPLPPALAAVEQRHPSMRYAWAVLSAVYASRSDLQAAFPQTRPGYQKALLQWASTWGVGFSGGVDVDHVYLSPFKSQIVALAKAAG